MDLLTGWNRKYQVELKQNSLSTGSKHQLLSHRELAKWWLEGGCISGPSLP